MIRFVIRRTIAAFLVLIAISILTFLIFVAIPNGNPALRLAGRTASPEDIASVEKAYGFNQPIYVQYWRMMKQIFSGKIQSYTQHLSVMSQFKRGLPATLSLAIGAAIIWLAVATVLGLLAGLHAGRYGDRAITVGGFLAISAPSFVVGALLLYFITYKAHWLPSSGYVGITSSPWQWARHLILPWLALSTAFIGVYSQVLRTSVIDTLNEDFVRTARAKGLSNRKVVIHHVLRTSLIPVISLWGLDFAGLVGGGAIIIESVFNLNGIGQYVARSIGALDVPPIMVAVLFGAFFVVLLSAIVDILYAFLDPRIRLEA
jgi:peptide/nickel transport system permease protein